MWAQFSTFRALRESAAAALIDGDEAAQKLARADVKAATDAMGLIIRTLENVDSLQCQMARDREIEAERVADEGGYEEAKARFVKTIEGKANKRALRLFEAWKLTGPSVGLSEPGRKAPEPADDTSGGGLHGGKDGEGSTTKAKVFGTIGKTRKIEAAAGAMAMVKAYRRFKADRVVAEVNEGGEMVAAMLKSVHVALPLAQVRAMRGKFAAPSRWPHPGTGAGSPCRTVYRAGRPNV